MRRFVQGARSFVWIEDLRRELRYALRTLARTPVFTASAILTLGIALGAEPRDILRLVVFRGLRLALAGVALGTVEGLIVTRLMSSLLYGVAPTDAPTFVVAATLLLLRAIFASYLPARRAAGVDPLIALRFE